MGYFFYKRIIDIFISLIILILILPFLIPILFLNFILTIQFPIFFQTRAGLYGKPFKLIKIKSMLDISHNKKFNRHYFLGNFLRRYKIDELPQLLNVIKGDMSLVGPRPLYIEYNITYTINEKKRLLTKPGITGLAQVKLNDSSKWRNKFKFDTWYVNNQSLKLDFYILILTIILIFRIIFFKKKLIEVHTLKI